MLALSDVLVKTVDGVAVARAGTVTAFPVNRPCLVMSGSDWLEEPMHKHRRATLAEDGSFTIDLPWPSETSLETDWIIVLDDGTKLRGAVPEDIAEATLDDLIETYGFAQVETAAVQAVVGPKGIRWRGAWDDATAYLPDDAVRFNGSSYIALAASTGDEPDTSSDSWDLLAAAGTSGGVEIP